MPINLLSIQVFGAGGSPQLQSKSVTPSASTQYVYPSSRYDGLSQVTINGDSNLISSNIKSGTSIFGVSGSLTPSFSNTVEVFKNPTTKEKNSLTLTLSDFYPLISGISCYIIIGKYTGAQLFTSYPTVITMMYAGYDSTGWESGLLMYGLEDQPYLNYARGGLKGDYSISSDKKTITFPTFESYGDTIYYNTSMSYKIELVYYYS